MVNITINNMKISVQAGTTILNAAHDAGIEIPHLCYWEGLNNIGACRVCVVELVGMEKLISACNTEVAEGMEILTGRRMGQRSPKGTFPQDSFNAQVEEKLRRMYQATQNK